MKRNVNVINGATTIKCREQITKMKKEKDMERQNGRQKTVGKTHNLFDFELFWLCKNTVAWCDKKTSERNKEPEPIEANVSLAPWANGCLEGAKKKGNDYGAAEKSMERSKGGSDLCQRPHDATIAYLSMKHDVAKQAASEMALKEVDTFFRPAHFSGSCDHFGTHFFVEATCSG